MSRQRCNLCHPHPYQEMARTIPIGKILGHARRALKAKSRRRRNDWLRAIPAAVRVWTLPLGVHTRKSAYHPDHPQHFTGCARAVHAHYPESDLSDVLQIVKQSDPYAAEET